MCDCVTIRPVSAQDSEPLCAIYNWAVINTTATFDIVERTIAQQDAWIAEHNGQPYPALVAIAKTTADVVGFASLSPVSDRPGYCRTVENSLYVHPAWHGKGIGHALLTNLIDGVRDRDFTTIVARISADNVASLRLHRRLGYIDAGLLRRVGWKFGREIDVAYLQLFLRDGAD